MASLKDSLMQGAARAKETAQRTTQRATQQSYQTPKTQTTQSVEISQLRDAYAALPEESRRKYAAITQRVLGADIESYRNDYDNLRQSYLRDQQRGYRTRDDANSFLGSTNSAADALNSRRDRYTQLMDIFGDDMDADFRSGVTDLINSTSRDVDTMRQYAAHNVDFFSQFQNEDEYNEYQRRTNAPALNVPGAIGAGLESGIWQGTVKGPIDMVAGYAAHKVGSDDSDTWAGKTAAQKTGEINEQFRDRLAQIWGGYTPGDGTLRQNLKDTAFAGYNSAFQNLLEGSGRLPVAGGGPEREALYLGANVLAHAFKTYALPLITGEQDAEQNEQWFADKAYGVSDKLTEAVAQNGGALQYVDNKNLQYSLANSGRGSQIAGNVANVIGNMIPSIAISTGTGSPDAGLLQMASSAGGSAAKEAYDAGATPEQAYYIGVEKGFTEYATEKMFDALGAFGGGQLTDGIKKLVDKFVPQRIGKVVAKALEMGGENIEEAVSDWASPGIERAVLGHTINGEEDVSIAGAMLGQMPWTEDGLTTVLSTVILQAMGGSANAALKNVVQISPQEAQEVVDYAKYTGDSNLVALAEQYQAKLDTVRKNGKQGSITYGQAERLEKKATKALIQSDLSTVTNAVEAKLKERGIDSPALANAIAAEALRKEGKRADAEVPALTREQRRLINGNHMAKQILEDLDIENLRNEEAGDGFTYRDNEWVKTMTPTKLLGADVYGKNAPENTVTEAEKASIKVNGETAKIVGAEDGKAIVEQNGERKTVALDDIEGIGKGYRQLVTAAANGTSGEAMLRLYNPGQNVDAYAKAWNLAENVYGAQTNISYEEARGKGLLRELTDNQLKSALELGRERYDAKQTQAKERSEQFKAAREKAKKQGTVQRKKGTVSYDGGEINGIKYKGADRSKFTRQQKKVAAMVEAMADAVNLDYMIVEGEKNTGGCYIQGGVVVININSGTLSGKTLGAATLSHELTHHLQDYAPEQYQELKDFIVAEILKQSPEQFNRMVQRQLALEPNLSYDQATDEMIANACQTMLLNSKAIEKLARQNMTLAERITDWISETAEKIKAAFEDVDLNDNISIYEPARAIAGVMDEVQELWDKALLAANENYNAEQATGKKNTAENGGKQRMATQIGDIDLADYADAKGTDGKRLFQVFAFENDEPQYREMLTKWGGMKSSEIDSLFRTVDSAMDVIKKNLEALDYAWEADIDDRAFSPVKPNSDKLYKVSQDFSTLCRKRILQGLVANHLQAALDRSLTREEGIAIRDALIAIQKEGKQIEVACALCYVESARMKSPAQIQRFLDNRDRVIRDYFTGKDKAGAKKLLQEAEARERQAVYEEYGLVRGKGTDNTLYDVRDVKGAPLKRLPGYIAARIRTAKRAARAGYTLTDEQQRVIETAQRMSVADFTTPEGLENLAKNHREIFDAYTSFIRNATKSKGIENDTWWRAGDSASVSDLLIEQMNAENGLRSQSWSDFQVKHLMDYIAATIEFATRGAKQQAYTKVIDYVDLMGLTNVMINMSLIPTREFTGKLAYDDVEGFVYKEALRLRDKFHATAGTICIGVDNQQIVLLLADDKIDYVIPYHRSGMAAHIRAAMHIPQWSEYEAVQNEQQLIGSEAKANAAKYGVKLLDASDPNWHVAPKFSDWFDLKTAQQEAELVGKSGKYGVMTGGYAAMRSAANRYLQLCAERGLAPKFGYGKADFTGEENYWKLLIDRKMVDNVTGEIIEQKAIKPIFDMDTIQRILNDELARYGRVKEDQNEAIRRVTEAFLGGKLKGGMSSEEIERVMQKPVDNISVVNITQNAQDVATDGGRQFQKWGIGETEAEQQERKESFDAIKAQNKILKARAEYWRGQTRQTKENTVRQQDTDRLANELLREYESKTDKAEVKAALKELGDWLVRQNGESLSYDELYRRARSIAEDVIDGNYSLLDNSRQEDLNRLKDFLKDTAMNISAADFRDTGDEGFRKKYGRYFTVSENGRSLDSAWGELSAMFGEGVFPEDVYAPGDMLNMIADYLDMWKPQYGNEFEQNRGEAVEWATGEIIDHMLSEEVRQTPATYADKAQQKLNAQIAKDREKLDTLRAQKNARIEQIRRQAAEKNKQIRIAEKAAKYEATAKVKQHYLDMLQRQRDTRKENAGQNKYRAQVKEKAATLQKMLQTNSDKLHVPEALKAPLAEFLSSIDFSSKSMLRNGTETQADRKFQSSLAALSDILSRQERNLNGDENADTGLDGYLDMSQESMDYLREMTEEIHKMLNTGGTFTVNSMTAEQLQGLSKLLSNITSAIRGMNNFLANERYATVREAADADIKYMDSLGTASDIERSGIFSAVAWKNGTPYYVLKRFGKGGAAIFESFTKGWERMARNIQEVMGFTHQTYTDKEVKAWKNEIHEIELSDGSKIQMTTAQIMAFSVLTGREQAMKHIEKGGIRIGDIKQKVGKRVDTKHYHLTVEDMAAITGTLTARQAEVAKKLQHYMALKGAAWGNEVSMRRFGYNFYDEGDAYFPIRTDSNDRGMQDTDAVQNSMFRLLNLSASKSLNPKASNALIVDDIFDVFADHMSDMAKLNGMGLPILDAIKWFNYKERIDLGDGEYDTRTLMGAMDQAFGDQAQRYFRTLMKDINGVTEAGDRGTDLVSKLMGSYKAASVGANLRVALLQPTSYVRASALISPQYLLKAFTSKNAYKEALENSGTALWKSLGYYDTNISRGMREQIKHDASIKDQIVEKSMTLAELGDRLTWGRLWVACKMQTKAQNPKLTGQDLINKTADLFRETIYATQVMDSTLTRSELMRGKSLSDKAMTSFMAEPTLSYNMLMDAASDYRLDVREKGSAGALQRNAGKITRAFSVYAASAAFAAVVESLADAVRDDDEDDFWQKFLDALFGEKDPDTEVRKILGGNLAQDLTVLGKLPYLKSFISTLQGYKSKDMSIEAFNSVVNAAAIWKESIMLSLGLLEKPTQVTYNGNMTTWGKISKTLQALSQLTGLPGYNMTRDATALWNTMVGDENPELKVKTYRSKSERIGIYFDALREGDTATAEQFNPGYASEKDEQAALKGHIREMYLGGEVESGELVPMLMQYSGMTRRSAEDAAQQWKMEVDTGIKFGDLQDVYLNGDVSRTDAVKYYRQYSTFGHTTQAEAEAKVLEWQCEKDTGIAYSDIDEEVKTGRLGKTKALAMVMKYGGKSEEAADKQVEGWLIEHEYNIRPSELQDEYMDGNVSVEDAFDILVRYQYNGKEDAEEKAYNELVRWNFIEENPGTEDITVTQIQRYQNSGLEGVVDGKSFLDAYEATNIMHGVDTDGDGKANRYTRVDQQLAYIDGMDLTSEQKTSLALALGINEKSVRNRAPWNKRR